MPTGGVRTPTGVYSSRAGSPAPAGLLRSPLSRASSGTFQQQQQQQQYALHAANPARSASMDHSGLGAASLAATQALSEGGEGSLDGERGGAYGDDGPRSVTDSPPPSTEALQTVHSGDAASVPSSASGVGARARRGGAVGGLSSPVGIPRGLQSREGRGSQADTRQEQASPSLRSIDMSRSPLDDEGLGLGLGLGAGSKQRAVAASRYISSGTGELGHHHE